MKFCPECGSENPDNAIYCQECGKKVENTLTEPQVKSKTPKKKKKKKKLSHREIKIALADKREGRGNTFKALQDASKEGNYFITGKGAGDLIHMVNNGIKTGDNQFIPYQNITSIQPKTNISKDTAKFGVIGVAGGLTLQTVEISFIGGKIIIKDVNKAEADKFIKAVRMKITKQTSLPENEKSKLNESKLDEIKKAKDLLDAGAISQEQFEEIRDKYLKMI